MVRRYGDPVEVRRGRVEGTEGPEQFLWRGRLYVVRGVLAHWVETGAWWRSASVRPVYGLDTDQVEDAATGVRGRGEPATDPPASAVAVLDDHGREVWRVEARAGRRGGPTVVDLALDEADGHWLLLRVHD